MDVYHHQTTFMHQEQQHPAGVTAIMAGIHAMHDGMDTGGRATHGAVAEEQLRVIAKTPLANWLTPAAPARLVKELNKLFLL